MVFLLFHYLFYVLEYYYYFIFMYICTCIHYVTNENASKDMETYSRLHNYNETTILYKKSEEKYCTELQILLSFI